MHVVMSLYFQNKTEVSCMLDSSCYSVHGFCWLMTLMNDSSFGSTLVKPCNALVYTIYMHVHEPSW